MKKYEIDMLDARLLVEDGIPCRYKNEYRYYTEGVLHRLDGPAVERDNGDHEYHIHGKRYIYEEWLVEAK